MSDAPAFDALQPWEAQIVAMEVWEAVLDALADPKRHPGIEGARNAEGMAALRHSVVAIVPAVWQGWTERAPDHFDGCFDWEWCPRFLVECVDWSFGPTLRPDWRTICAGFRS